MNTWFRLERYRQTRWFFLGLVFLLVLAVIGFQVWVSASRSPTSSENVFTQTAERSGTNQPLSARNLSHLHPLWVSTFAPDIPYDMTVANGIVYLIAAGASGNGLVVVAVRDGRRLWRYQMPDLTRNLSTWKVGGDAVYLAMATRIAPYTDNAIYAVNAHTGQELWQYRSETSIDHLASDNALLYFSTANEVHALDARTGKLQWSYQFSDGSPYSPVEPSLVAASGNLYLALWTSPYRAGTSLLALDGRTGNVQWQLQEVGVRSSSLPGASSFLVENGVIYRPVNYSVPVPNAKVGEDQWHVTYQISAVNATTGKELWQSTESSSDSMGYNMHVARNLLYINGQNRIQARDLSTGHLVWSSGQLEGSDISIEPVVSNGVVYVATEERLAPWSRQYPRYWIYAFDAQSGKLVRMLEDADSSFRPGTVKADNEYLYVLGDRLLPGSDNPSGGKPELDALGV